MHYELSETQQLIQRSARGFAQKELVPNAARFEKEETIPSKVLANLAELGLMGVNIKESLGGAEAGVVSYALALSEIAKGCASSAVSMAVTNMVAEVITRFGDEEQRITHVPRICSGEYRTGAFALSEPEAGSDPGSMRTSARKEGDTWVIEGTKQWITNGSTAGVIVLWARTGESGNKGISCFLVTPDAPGLRIGRHEDKLGLRASDTVPLVFENCKVPLSAQLGELGDGFKVAMTALDGGRISIAAQCCGIASAAFAEMLSYAKERRQFGREIASFQAIQWMIADSQKELDAMELLTLRAALMKERGQKFSTEASMAKLYASEAAWRICNRAIQVHGGYGYTREFAAERHFRDVRATQIYEGTSEIQRLIIARSLLSA